MNTLNPKLEIVIDPYLGHSCAQSSEHAIGVKAPNQNVSLNINASFIAKKSVFFGGLGQVYLGQNSKGFSIMIVAFIGFVGGFLPGVLITILGIVDAYIMACRLNDKGILGRWECFWHTQ